jgi:putative transposase
MRKARFTDEQMVAIIREADREPVSVVRKRHCVSEQTIYTWRKRFGGFQANEVRRLKQLEAENARLKKLVAERDLEIEVMKEVAAKNGPARRRQVAYGREHGLSVRRACTLFKVARSVLSYRGRKAARDAPLVEQMRELSAQDPRLDDDLRFGARTKPFEAQTLVAKLAVKVAAPLQRSSPAFEPR